MPEPIHALTFILIGALGGIVIGILGTGSSLIILPTLSIIFSDLFPEHLGMRFAIGTCISSIAVGALSGSYSYIKEQQFDRSIFMLGLPGLVMGSLLAPLLSSLLPAEVLKIYISLFLITIAIYKLGVIKTNDLTLPKINKLYIVFFTFFCALASGLAGVALGILLIPALSRYLSHQQAVGSSIVLAAIYAVISTLGYIVVGVSDNTMTGANLSYTSPSGLDFPLQVGYVYLPAFLLISIPIFIFPLLGAKIAQKIPTPLLEKIFYSFLLIAGCSLLFN